MYFINLELFFLQLWPSKYFKANSIKKYSWTLIDKMRVSGAQCFFFFSVTTELQTCRNWRNSGNFYLLLNYKIIFKAAHSMHTFVHISSNCIEWLHALFLPKKKPQSKIKCDIFVCFHTNHDSFLCLRVCFYKCTSTFTECA